MPPTDGQLASSVDWQTATLDDAKRFGATELTSFATCVWIADLDVLLMAPVVGSRFAADTTAAARAPSRVAAVTMFAIMKARPNSMMPMASVTRRTIVMPSSTSDWPRSARAWRRLGIGREWRARRMAVPRLGRPHHQGRQGSEPERHAVGQAHRPGRVRRERERFEGPLRGGAADHDGRRQQLLAQPPLPGEMHDHDEPPEHEPRGEAHQGAVRAEEGADGAHH